MNGKSFFDTMRELVLGFGIAIVVPFIAHYTAVIVHPKPERPAYVSTDKKENREENDRLMNEYIQKRAQADKIYFWITITMALACLIVGAIIPLASIGMGFVLAGLICILEGYWAYWSYLNNIVKLISLIVVLFIILGLSYRFIRRK